MTYIGRYLTSSMLALIFLFLLPHNAFSSSFHSAESFNHATQTIHSNQSVIHQIGEFLTSPLVVIVLLTIGCVGLVLELFTPAFGLSGTIGLLSFFLFFFGHLITGVSGFDAVIVFIVGIVLILLEIFLIGGIAGVLGIGAIVTSFFLATDNNVVTGIAIIIAVIVALGGAWMMVKFFGRKLSGFQKFVLNDSMKTESGYVSNPSRMDLIGKIGVTTTPLRPSGTMMLDEEYLDVVTEGSYLPKDIEVKIIKVEGVRIVVRKI